MWQYNTNELYHHGVLGMKWGVRRYQNTDGTLTAAGKKRYQIHRGDSNFTKWVKKRRKASDDAKIEKINQRKADKEAKKASEKEIKEYKKLSKKDPSKMTNEELAKHIVRLQTEKQTLSLRDDIKKLSPYKEEGKKFVEKNPGFRKHFAENAVKPALTNAGKDLLTTYFKNVGGKLMGLNKDEMDASTKMLKDMAEKAGYKKTIASSKLIEKQAEEKEAMVAKSKAEQRTAEAKAKKAEAEAKAAVEAAKRTAKANYTTSVSSPSFSSNVSSGESFVRQYSWDDYYDDWV